MAHKSWITAGFVAVCCSMSIVSKTVQPFRLSRKLLCYTHACTKLHNHESHELNSGAYECHYAWPLPEASTTTVCDLTVPSVSSLSWFAVALSSVWSRFTEHEFVLARVQICNPFAQFIFSVYGHAQTYIHTRQAMQSR